jgi:hypothetical protein
MKFTVHGRVPNTTGSAQHVRGCGKGLPLPRRDAFRPPRPRVPELPCGASRFRPSGQDRRLRSRQGHIQERLL